MADELAAGARVGKFEIVGLLSRGEQSAVYRAREVSTGRPVAVKVPLGENPAELTRFRREARVAASLRHRHIVETIEAGEDGGRPFLAMEFVDGGDLAAAVAREGRPTAARSLLMMKQAASALAYLHGMGIVHCDIQPGNLLVTALGQVELADFGLARCLDDEEDAPSAVRRIGSPSSAPLYFPPEAAHARELDERSDLYLLGATFYHILAGRPPFEAADPVERALKYVRGDVPPLAEAAPTVPRELCDLIHHLLRKNPAERLQNADDLLAALERIEGEMVRGRRPRTDHAAAPAPPSAVPRLASPAVPAFDTVGQADRGTRDSSAPASATAGLPDRAPPPSAPVAPKAPRPPLAALVGGGMSVLAVGILVGYCLGRGARLSLPHGPTPHPVMSASAEPEPVEHSPSVEPKVTTATEQAPVIDEKAKAEAERGRAAWAQAEVDAAGLVREQRFGAAIACYKEAARRFRGDVSEAQIAAATGPIRERAETAYAATAAVARQLAQEKKFDAARGELLGAIERYGVDELAVPAKELLASLAAAEKQAKEDGERQRLDADRRAESERLKAADARYRQVIAPVDALAGAWDFRGALAKLPAPDALTGERIETRRDGLQRLAQLKDRIIARINTAKPPLRKNTVLLPGVNGELVKAGDSGITTLAPDGKPEAFAWSGLSKRSARTLALLAADPKSGEDHVALGLVALAYDDIETAEQELAKARSIGVNPAGHRAALAQILFSRANDLVAKKDYRLVEDLLVRVERMGAETPWLERVRPELALIRDRIREAVGASDLGLLYARAVEHFKRKEMFEVKQLVDQLKTRFAGNPALGEPVQGVTLREMADAVADLGRVLAVRRDGMGDFRTIEEALAAATPKGLIEIQDDGPYTEALTIPLGCGGLILRAKKGSWPILNSKSLAAGARPILDVKAPNVTLAGLVLVESSGMGEALRIRSTPCQLRSCIIFSPPTSKTMGFVTEAPSSCDIKTCVFVGSANLRGASEIHDSLWVETDILVGGQAIWTNVVLLGKSVFEAPAGLRFATVMGVVSLRAGPNSLLDSVMGTVESARADTRVEQCDVFGRLGFGGFARPGKGCIFGEPRFVDPAKLDFRLAPKSPGRGLASDGADMGCRYTPEMTEVIEKALELRRRGTLHF